MNRKQVYILVALLFPLIVIGQPAFKHDDCSRVKTGTFYFYPSDKPKGFTVIRKGGMQTEINLSTGDTTYWKVTWKKECSFELRFIRKSSPISSDERKFYDSHTAVFEVLKYGKDYYIFKVGVDSTGNPTALTDTMWFKTRRP